MQQVYRSVLDHRNLKHWIDDFKYYTLQKGNRKRQGDKGVLVFEDADGKLEVEEIITQIQKNKTLTTQLSHQQMNSTVQIRFLDQGTATKLIVNTHVQLKPAIANLFSIFMKSGMQKKQAADFKRLKTFLEP